MVLFTSYSGVLGGAERLLVDWAVGLPGERFLACPEGSLADAARRSGLRVLPLRARRLELRGRAGDRLLAPGRLLAHALELRRLVTDLEPDLVVAWGMRSAIALGVGPHVRSPLLVQHNDLLPGPAIGWLVRAAARRADAVTVPSRAVAADLALEERLGGRVEVVHPGVDANRFAAAPPPAPPPEVLVLGALVPWKRPDLALEVCALARRRLPDLRLRLVGAPLDGAADLDAAAGRFTAAVRTRAAQPDLDGAVELAGPSEDVAAELARATCLLHCAEREPFGIAVLEALASGRPAIVPDAAGPAEIVDASCGFLYPPGNAPAAADALVRVLSDRELTTRMGAAGRARARSRFDRAAARAAWTSAADRVRRPSPAAGSGGSLLEVVTVTHNSAAFLGALLSSVERHLAGVRVLVVDSGSGDDTVSVARRSPAARVVALAENVGFGRACNRGVAEVQAPVTALLNPDVQLVDSSLLELARSVSAREAPARDRLLAPLVLSTDGSRQDSVHPVPGSPGDLIRSVLSPRLLPGRLAAALEPSRGASAHRVGWAVGCALVGRTETLRLLGPFDERIFLYGEDLDLGLRAGQGGVETWFDPSARVVHHSAHATGAAFGGEPFELLARARRSVVADRLGPRRAALDDAAQAVTFATRIAAKRALGRPLARERSQLRALMKARRGPWP